MALLDHGVNLERGYDHDVIGRLFGWGNQQLGNLFARAAAIRFAARKLRL
jgi:hypothetical protein